VPTCILLLCMCLSIYLCMCTLVSFCCVCVCLYTCVCAHLYPSVVCVSVHILVHVPICILLLCVCLSIFCCFVYFVSLDSCLFLYLPTHLPVLMVACLSSNRVFTMVLIFYVACFLIFLRLS
jgi:hypothetical protein